MSERTAVAGASLPEAPVSWTVRYKSTQGFDCMLTLRGADAAEVLRAAHALLERMAAAGVRPASESVANGNGNGADGEVPLCPTHKMPMKRSQHGGWYCPVKVADDDGTGKPVYCKQRSK